MNWSPATSYALCERLAREQAANFYYAFLVLPRAKRQAICALYAFLRHTDDLGDSDRPVEERRAALARWRESLSRALAGEYDSPLLPALADTLARFAIDPVHLEAVLEGVEWDLAGRSYETWEDLAEYCHRVASAVGLACIHIWGFRGPEALVPARQCGLAFQLTNIIRDLAEDARLGRLYLPAEEMRRFGVGVADLTAARPTPALRALVRYQVDRAERLYREARQLSDYLSRDGQAAYATMWEIYHALLEEIRRRDGDVLGRRVRVSTLRKLGIVSRWLLPGAVGWPARWLSRGGASDVGARLSDGPRRRGW